MINNKKNESAFDKDEIIANKYIEKRNAKLLADFEQLTDPDTLLEVEHLHKSFPLKKSLTGKVLQELIAVNDISFVLHPGETLGIVGESGCGKTTMGRTMLRLYDISGGRVIYKNLSVEKLSNAQLRRLLRDTIDLFHHRTPRQDVLEKLYAGALDLDLLPVKHLRRLLLATVDPADAQASDYRNAYRYGDHKDLLIIAKHKKVNIELLETDVLREFLATCEDLMHTRKDKEALIELAKQEDIHLNLLSNKTLTALLRRQSKEKLSRAALITRATKKSLHWGELSEHQIRRILWKNRVENAYLTADRETLIHMVKKYGVDISLLNRGALQRIRPDIQIIFQDPYSSLPPRSTVGDILSEPVHVHKVVPKNEVKDYVLNLMDRCGLRDYYYERYPHEFSGGQRQRICIARALSVKPQLVVCDEPVSALDVSIQAQIINLLKELQKSMNLTYLFISHDLSVVKFISDKIGVMYLGSMVEYGNKKDIFANPLHPYTKALFSAVPTPNPDVKMDRIVLKGDIPSPANPPKGCRFHTRCPHATEKCKNIPPEYREIEPGHFAACHLLCEEPVNNEQK